MLYISNKSYLIICIICNPPFKQCISTNIAKVFLKLLDKHFRKSSILHNKFKRNFVKVNNSCTQNHDRSIFNLRTEKCLPYNCQKKEEHGVLQISPHAHLCQIPPFGIFLPPTAISSPPPPPPTTFPFHSTRFPSSRILAID